MRASSDLLVLCYHAVSERWPADLSITPANLEAQLELLARRGYRGVTFTEAVADPPSGKAVAVTFDDGYRSVLALGEPILARLGWPATIFAATDFTGTERPMSWPGIDHWLGSEFEPELVPLGWDELGGLAERGWEVGSHTCSHPRLTQLGDAALEDELRRSKALCEEHLRRECLAHGVGLAQVEVDLDLHRYLQGVAINWAPLRASRWACDGKAAERRHTRRISSDANAASVRPARRVAGAELVGTP